MRRVRQVAAQQHLELADEAVEPGQADGGERREEEEERKHRHDSGDAPVIGDLARVAPLVDHPDEQEERPRREAVVHHLDHAALQTLRGERERPEHDEPEVADRRVGDQPLHVGLHDGHGGAVDDADHGERDQPGRKPHRGLREEGEVEAKEAVRPQLQQDAGQQHGARRRRLGVGVRQPRVEREQWDLDRKRDAEGQEQPRLRSRGELEVEQCEVVEGDRPELIAGQHPQRDDGDHHQTGPERRVQDELDRGVDAVAAAPHADQQVHRDERDLEEHEEQQEVEGEEHTEQAGLEDQHRHHVRLHVLRDGGRGQDGDREQQRGQHDQQQRDAVDTHVPGEVPRFVPEHALGELETGFA